MPIIVTATLANGSAQEADRWNHLHGAKLKQAPGFILHVDGPAEGGWQIAEVRESRELYDAWFQTEVEPNLPPGVVGGPPRISDVHSLVKPD
jgi:hypothetical protein